MTTNPFTFLRSLGVRRKSSTIGKTTSRVSRSRSKDSVIIGIGFVFLLNLGLNFALETSRPEWREV